MAYALGAAIAVHGIYDFLLMFAAVPTQLRGLSVVLWLVFFVALYYVANEIVETLKSKDQALKAAKNAGKEDFYHIRTR
jgi:hypothetical protein